MKIKVLIAFLAMPLFALAQPPSPDEYEVITPEDKLLSSYGNKYPGYYITKDGKKNDCLILFQEGDKINNSEVQLTTSLAHQGTETMIDKSSLNAFFVKNKLYVPVNINGVLRWVSLETQGAIRVIHDATFNEKKVNKKMEFWYDKEKETNVGYWDTLGVIMPHWTEVEYIQKLDHNPEVILMLNKKNMLSLVGDYVEMATKIENKEDGYKNSLTDLDYKDRMFGMYNKWFDENNPGAIIYYEARATFVAPDKPLVVAASGAVEEVVTTAVSNYEKEVISAAEEANRAPRIDPFKGRPTTVSADVASAKPEVAVKKESFKERLARIKADGNKVGILVTSKNLVINPGTGSTEGVTKANVLGNYGPLEGLDKIAKATADDLNTGFGIDVFEVVDYSKIPVKEGKYGKLDDWWGTKYKMIVLYEFEPSYSAIYKTINSETNEREFQAKMHVHGEMIIMSAEDIKPDKLMYVTSSPKTWGYFNSEKYTASAETNFNTIQQLKAAINPPSDEEVVEEIIISQKESLDKFVSKNLK